MSARTTFILVLAAIGLGGYVLFVDQRLARPSESMAGRGLVFPGLKPLSVSAIELRLSNGVVRAERVGDHWQLRTPRYAAQPTAIEDMLQFVAGLTNLDYLPPDEAGPTTNAASGFGFSPPQAAIRLESSTNRREFQIGAKTLLREGVYLQKNGDAGVYVTDKRLLDYLPRSPDEWRDQRVVAIGREDFDGFVLTSGKGTLALRYNSTNEAWMMDRPVRGWRVNEKEAERLLFQIDRILAYRFVSDEPKADLEAFGLSEPVAELRYLKGTNQVLQVLFGKPLPADPNFIFARSSLYSNVVSLAASLVERLRPNPNDLRDPRLLEFDPAQVTKIDVISRGERFALSRVANSNLWQYAPAAAEVDPQLVGAFLSRLAGLNVAVWESDVVGNLAPYVIQRPDVSYVLYASTTNQSGPTNVVLASLELSTNNVVRERPDLLYARRGTNDNVVFGLNVGDTDLLPRNAFQFRHRQIWQFATTNLLRARVLVGGKTNLLERDASGMWSPDKLKNAGIEEAFVRLGNLRTEEWLGQGEQRFRNLFPDPRNELRLELLGGGRTNILQMSFGSLENSVRPYASIVAEGNRLIFSLPPTLWSDWLPYLLP